MEVRIQVRAIIGYILVAIGTILILVAIFQAYSNLQPLSEFAEGLRQQNIDQLAAFVHGFVWFFALLITVVGGFFIGSLGAKMIKK